MDIYEVLVSSLYLLAMINPVSKISVLAIHSNSASHRDITQLVINSTLVAAAILLLVMLFGEFVFHRIFHIEIYSLRVAGGIVLLWAGFNALHKGVFFESTTQQNFRDLAMVPLACPMIAGPATIVASASLTTEIGMAPAVIAMLLAVAVNGIIMYFSDVISNILKRFNLLGAIIRITGLVVMAIGTQMILAGFAAWMHGNSAASDIATI